MNNLVSISGVHIRQDAQGRYCLNDIHKASGGEARHKIANWLQLKQTIELINELSTAGIPALPNNQPLMIYHGENGLHGTFAVRELLYAYTMWISPSFHVKVIRTFDYVVTNGWPQAKPTNGLEWQQQRQLGKEARNTFTDTLKEHGVTGFGYAQCTNGIYQPLFGATATQLKQQRGSAKASLRDIMSNKELLATSFAEMVAAENIESKEVQGNSPCYHTCKQASEQVKGLLGKQLPAPTPASIPSGEHTINVTLKLSF